MTSKIEDGGSAFPIGTFEDRQGMSLCDWFAGQALAGMFNHSGWINTVDDDQDEVARRAYAIADAMITLRRARAS